MSVLLMHGLGADGYDFADVAQMLIDRSGPEAGWRFILPHAPPIPVTINMGMVMPAWYDILDMSQPREVNWQTVESSDRAVQLLVEEEQADKIVLAGFSQGGAMALHSGLRRQSLLSGILVMSGYLLEAESHPCPEKQTDIPIGLFHGTADPVVPLIAAEHSHQTLNENHYSPTLKTYPGLEHSVSMEEIDDVFHWLDSLSRT